MSKNFRTIVFDLDGTIYQNTTFHKDYIHFLVQNTKWALWEPALIEFTDRVFAGQALTMNRFYKNTPLNPQTPEEYFSALEQHLCPPISYDQALTRNDILYLGDAWAVVTLIGDTLGLLEGERRDQVYRLTRRHMEEQGMVGNATLKQAIQALTDFYDVILLSNSHEETALEFLRQLGYERLFPLICSSANKPFEMVTKLEEINPLIFAEPESVLSIGDHAFNDLMPIKEKGGRTVWLNPFPNIQRAECDLELHTLDDLVGYLKTLVNHPNRS
ncbi:MAG: HAD family hydrolase [Firmicutes bacterium]|nr:HAD family hydrolase [Bacillota bacterium]